MWRALTTSDWISIAGTAVSVIGFAVAIFQLRRVATAVRGQQRQTAGTLLVSRTGDLERIESDIRDARDRAAARRAILEWRRMAAELVPLLDLTGRGTPELLESLEFSLAIVDVALKDLDDENVPQLDATRSLLEEVSRTCRESRTLGAAMMVEERP